jgi:hypothetical protein
MKNFNTGKVILSRYIYRLRSGKLRLHLISQSVYHSAISPALGFLVLMTLSGLSKHRGSRACLSCLCLLSAKDQTQIELRWIETRVASCMANLVFIARPATKQLGLRLGAG